MIEKSKSYSAIVIREAKDATYLRRQYGEKEATTQDGLGRGDSSRDRGICEETA